MARLQQASKLIELGPSEALLLSTANQSGARRHQRLLSQRQVGAAVDAPAAKGGEQGRTVLLRKHGSQPLGLPRSCTPLQGCDSVSRAIFARSIGAEGTWGLSQTNA